MNSHKFLLDVSITNPSAPSYAQHSQKELEQARRREQLKYNKYNEISAKQHANFIPFVIKAYGGLGEQAKSFIDTLSRFTRDNSTIASHHDIITGLRYAIACSVQRGNAMIMTAGLAKASAVDI